MDAAPGALVVVAGRIRIVLTFIVTDRIIGIEAMADPARIAELDIVTDEPARR